MSVIHDERGLGVTEFPEVADKRVVPTKVQESALPSGAATEDKQDDVIAELEALLEELEDISPLGGFATEDKQDDVIAELEELNAISEYPIAGEVADGVTRIPRIDTATRSFVTVEYEHHEVHAGDSFKADVNTDDLDSEGDENALHLSFTTANTAKWMHLLVEASATGEADLSIVEAPAGGVAGGDDLLIFNKDRNSSTGSGAISTNSSSVNRLTKDASAPTGGTEIHHWKFGTGKNKIGNGIRSIEEFVLKQNTKYSFRMTTAVDNIVAQLTLHWYEHVNDDEVAGS